MKKFETRIRPLCCNNCSFSLPHSCENGKLIKRCKKLEQFNSKPDTTVLKDCPLPTGESEEDYCCVRDKNV